MPNIFNEKAVKSLVKKIVKEEYLTYRAELDKIWEYLNKLRDEIKTVETAFSLRAEREELEKLK